MPEMSKTENAAGRCGRWRSITMYLLIAALMFMGGGCVFYFERTLVQAWKPISVSVAVGALFAIVPVMRHRASGILGFILRWAGGSIAVLFMILSVNYHCRSAESIHTESVTITRKYHETRYHTRRVRKNVTRRGEPYEVYFMDVRFDSGMTKTFDITLSRYNKVKVGRRFELETGNGLLGMPVITTVDPI